MRGRGGDRLPVLPAEYRVQAHTRGREPQSGTHTCLPCGRDHLRKVMGEDRRPRLRAIHRGQVGQEPTNSPRLSDYRTGSSVAEVTCPSWLRDDQRPRDEPQGTRNLSQGAPGGAAKLIEIHENLPQVRTTAGPHSDRIVWEGTHRTPDRRGFGHLFRGVSRLRQCHTELLKILENLVPGLFLPCYTGECQEARFHVAAPPIVGGPGGGLRPQDAHDFYKVEVLEGALVSIGHVVPEPGSPCSLTLSLSCAA